jgi:hypothetical protein
MSDNGAIVEFSTNDVSTARRYLKNGDTDYLSDDTIEAILDCVRYGHGFRVRDPYMYGNSPDLTYETTPEGEALRLLNRVKELQDRDWKARPGYVDWKHISEEDALNIANDPKSGEDDLKSVLFWKPSHSTINAVLKRLPDGGKLANWVASAISKIGDRSQLETFCGHGNLSNDDLEFYAGKGVRSAFDRIDSDGAVKSLETACMAKGLQGWELLPDLIDKAKTSYRISESSKSIAVRGIAFGRRIGKILVKDVLTIVNHDKHDYGQTNEIMFTMGVLSNDHVDDTVLLALARYFHKIIAGRDLRTIFLNDPRVKSSGKVQKYIASFGEYGW